MGSRGVGMVGDGGRARGVEFDRMPKGGGGRTGEGGELGVGGEVFIAGECGICGK